MSGMTLSRRLVIVVALALLAHTLLMVSAQAHTEHTLLQHAAIAVGHAPAQITVNPADLNSEFAVHPEHQPSSSGCGTLTPLKSTGGGGERPLDRPAPIIVAPTIATGSWPMPDEPTHLYPPGVRRALLQVYRN